MLLCISAYYLYDSTNKLKLFLKKGGFFLVRSYDAGVRELGALIELMTLLLIFVYNGLNLQDEVDGGVHKKHVFAGGMHIASNTSDTVNYYPIDHLGSTRLKSANYGLAVYELNYEPFRPGDNETGSSYYLTTIYRGLSGNSNHISFFKYLFFQ